MGYGGAPSWVYRNEIAIRLTIIHQFSRSHMRLPQCFRWVIDGEFWNLEPRSFTQWTLEQGVIDE